MGESLAVLASLLPTIKVNKKNVERQLGDESLYATDLADYLVSRGVAFGRAHHIIGRLVKYAIEKEKSIKDLTDTELKKFSPNLGRAGVLKCLSAAASVASKKSIR